MKKNVSIKRLKFLLCVTLFTVLTISLFTSAYLTADEGGSHVLVVLKDKQVIKLDYHTFSFNWLVPQVIDFLSCRAYGFEKEDLVTVQVIDKKENLCDGSGDDQWTFEVTLKSRGDSTLLGFIPLSGEEVAGYKYGNSEYTVIPMEIIQRVSFYYQ